MRVFRSASFDLRSSMYPTPVVGYDERRRMKDKQPCLSSFVIRHFFKLFNLCTTSSLASAGFACPFVAFIT
jgi:hypothetical protein